ncbi:hypothetical protein BLOT_005065 [Blomia tropicalis]|nr:hypothetical protein BLOT_005065 [Blomia tropicalis]
MQNLQLQSLIQQLLNYYFASSNLGSLPLNPFGKSVNSGLSINLLFHNVSWWSQFHKSTNGLVKSTSSYDYGHGNSSLGSTEKRVMSANWAKDKDINRLAFLA